MRALRQEVLAVRGLATPWKMLYLLWFLLYIDSLIREKLHHAIDMDASYGVVHVGYLEFCFSLFVDPLRDLVEVYEEPWRVHGRHHCAYEEP